MIIDLYFSPFEPNQKTNIYFHPCRMLVVDKMATIARNRRHYPLDIQKDNAMMKSRKD